MPITDSDMRQGVYLTGGGRGIIPAGQSYPPAEHPEMYHFSWRLGRELPEFQFILITEGCGEFESEPTGLVELTCDTLIVLFPGVWHRYRPAKASGWTERWVSLHGVLLHDLIDIGSLSPESAVFPVPDSTFSVQIFDGVLNRLHAEPAIQTAAIRIGAMQLLALVVDHCPERPQAAAHASERLHHVEDELVLQTLQIIWTQSHRSLSVNKLCSQLPTTRRTLERRFSKTLGHTLLDEINLCRISRAKRLLVETRLQVKSIAYMSGFGSQERLRCLMISMEGCSPTEYREQNTWAPTNMPSG